MNMMAKWWQSEKMKKWIDDMNNPSSLLSNFLCILCMQQGLNLRRSKKRTDYESIAFDHSAIHAAAILSIKTKDCKIVLPKANDLR